MRRVLASFFILLWLTPAAANAEWLRAESPNFIVYSEGSEARLRERVALLENFDSLLRLFTGVESQAAPAKLHVYIVRGPSELRSIRPVREGTAGFYQATAHGIAAIVDGRADAGANEVLFHEYAHHFMMQYAPNAYPAWYVEGFADYFATAEFREREIHVGKFSDGRIHAAVDRDWLPMDRVLFGDTNGMNQEQVARFYAQSWLVTHYFFSTSERQALLRRYLAAAREGNPAAAIEAATRMDPERLTRELRNYIRGRRLAYRRIGQAPAAPPPIAITRLPDVADTLMLHHASLRLGLPDEDDADTLHAIRTAAARHGDDPFARRVLAHAEAIYGDAVAADRLLDALIAETPEDVETLYLKGMRHLRAAKEGDDWESQAREARRWFARAHRADGNHFQTLYRYAESLRSEREFVSDNTTNVLLLAQQLAPQVTEIRMNAAMQALGRNDRELVEFLLRPLAADPHNSGLADAARRMMEQGRNQADAPATASQAGEPKGRD
jgi:hypothetical protein